MLVRLDIAVTDYAVQKISSFSYPPLFPFWRIEIIYCQQVHYHDHYHGVILYKPVLCRD